MGPARLGIVVSLVLLIVLAGLHPASGSSRNASPWADPGASTRVSAGSAGAVGFIAINISNDGPTPTGTYDQAITISTIAYANLINSNFTNVRALYAVSSVSIDAWIESDGSGSSGAAMLWLRLASIPAFGSEIILLACDPKNAFDLSANGPMGESPLLSSQYAAFDDGAMVFNFYDNFVGTSLSSLWSIQGPWSYTVHDGVQISSVPGAGDNITSATTFPYGAVVDFYGDLYQTTALTSFITEGIGLDACSGCAADEAAGWISGSTTSSGPAPFTGVGTQGSWGTSVSDTPSYGIFTTELLSSSSDLFAYNYTAVSAPSPVFAPAAPEPIGLALSSDPSGPLTNTETTYWVREHPYVPEVVSTVLGEAPFPRAALAAYPGTLAVNSSLTLVTALVAGIAPSQYAYADLPPGCTAQNTPVLSCIVRTTGTFHPMVTVVDATGRSTIAQANVSVVASSSSTGTNGPLSVVLAATPEIGPVNGTFTLLTLVAGGTAPFQYTYAGLPSSCVTVDQPTLECRPQGAGSFSPSVQVKDATGALVSATTELVVQSARSTVPQAAPPTSGSGVPTSELEILAALSAVGVVLAVAALILASRRRTP